MTSVPVAYHLASYRKEQLWLPLALAGLFVIIVTLFQREARAIEMAGAFLHFVLPLLAGILAASAVLDDPALELHLAAPRRVWQTLFERLALLLGIVTIVAVLFQAYLLVMAIPMGHFGGLMAQQMAWIVPSLAMMSLVCLASLASAQAATGAMIGGIVWIVQLMLHGLFEGDTRLRYVALFLGDRAPQSPNLLANQLGLVVLSLVMLVLAAKLLQREERYL